MIRFVSILLTTIVAKPEPSRKKLQHWTDPIYCIFDNILYNFNFNVIKQKKAPPLSFLIYAKKILQESEMNLFKNTAARQHSLRH
jgi:hypothetical protein